jgi:hypothetical protein
MLLFVLLTSFEAGVAGADELELTLLNSPELIDAHVPLKLLRDGREGVALVPRLVVALVRALLAHADTDDRLSAIKGMAGMEGTLGMLDGNASVPMEPRNTEAPSPEAEAKSWFWSGMSVCPLGLWLPCPP